MGWFRPDLFRRLIAYFPHLSISIADASEEADFTGSLGIPFQHAVD